MIQLASDKRAVRQCGSGIAGGAGTGYGAATNGTTVAEIYDPRKPIGQRWSKATDSKIWRLYHSVAFLTPNAEVSFLNGKDIRSKNSELQFRQG